jgi:PBSX family phage terminase large subunit
MLPLVETTIRLHAAQKAFRRSDAPYRGFVGGRGAGKSWVGAYDLIRRARADRTYLVVSPTGTLLHDTTYPTFKEIATKLGRWGSVKLTPYPTVILSTGGRVRFRTADDPEKMRGPNLSGCWLDEASLMDHEAYLIAIAALREGGERGWLSATFTPKGFGHWTYAQFGKALPDTAIFHCATHDNPFLPPNFQTQLEQQYGARGLLAQQELGGQFVAVEGAEWPPEYFPPSIWFNDWPIDPTIKTIALDPSKGKEAKSGDYSAFAMLMRTTDGMLYCECDLDQQRTSERIIEDAIEHQRNFVADAFAVETNVFQELLATQLGNVSRQRGIMVPIVPVVNTTKKEVRIRRLGPHLARGGIRFRNTRGTHLAVQQMRDFPEGEHDDGPDAVEIALRVMIETWNGKHRPKSKGFRL